MIKDYECWCFDLDGTLIDIKTRYTILHNKLITELGGRPITNYWQRRKEGKLEEELYFDTLTPKHMIYIYDKRREKLLEELNYLKFDRLFPAVYSLLKYLKRENRQANIVTHRSNFKNLILQLKTLKLEKLFTKKIITKKKNMNKKFKNLSFSKQGEDLASLAKSEELKKFKNLFHTVMVGDSPTDISAAHIAKVDSIAIPTGLHDSDSLLKLKPTFLFKSIKNLYQNLNT